MKVVKCSLYLALFSVLYRTFCSFNTTVDHFSRDQTDIQVCRLTLVARTPRLISIVAGDPQYALLYGCAVDVLHWARRFKVFLNCLVHHQVLELSELRANVRKPSGAHVGRFAHPAEKREQRGLNVLSDKSRPLGKEKGSMTILTWWNRRLNQGGWCCASYRSGRRGPP